MPNRYYSNFNGKLSAPTPPKDKARSSTPPYPERTRDWLTDIGPVGPKRNTVGFPEVKQAAKQHLADDKGLTKKKARKMLHDDSAHGEPLTEKQRGLFGAVASGKSKKKMMGKY